MLGVIHPIHQALAAGFDQAMVTCRQTARPASDLPSDDDSKGEAFRGCDG
ncbi:hypothetical protein [Micromonospora zamorensis]